MKFYELAKNSQKLVVDYPIQKSRTWINQTPTKQVIRSFLIFNYLIQYIIEPH